MGSSEAISMTTSTKHPARKSIRHLLIALLLPLPLLIAGCALEFLNAKPARELNPPAPSGNLYAGWRVFQDKCASCHGMTATGSGRAPDLLPIVREMSGRQFAEVVLKRYDLGNNPAQGTSSQSTMDTRIEEILRYNEPPIEMPGWQGEPAVNAHVLDLYAYLLARADGKLGLGRPPR